MNLSDFVEHTEPKLDMFHMQCQFTYRDTFMFALYSRDKKDNIYCEDIDLEYMPDILQDLINNKRIELLSEDTDVYSLLHPRIKDGNVIISEGNNAFRNVNDDVLTIPLNDMPEAYITMYTKYKLLEK